MRHGIKTLLLIFNLILFAGCSKVFSPSTTDKLYTIAFYNTQNTFDTINNPEKDDDAFTPKGNMEWTQEKYNRKIQKLSEAIATIGGGNGPAIIGLSEIENKLVLQDLTKALAQKKHKYQYIHFETGDEHGLDLAILYKANAFKVESKQSIKINFGSGYTSRDILKVTGKLQGQPLTIFVNHWPSLPENRRGKQDDSRLKVAAKTLRKEINIIQAADPEANIIVMGDFNTEPKSNIMKQVLNATGRPNPYYKDELFNTSYMHYVNGLGSYYSRGDFKMLDQILISKSFITRNGLEYVRGSANIHEPDEMKFMYGKYKNTPLPTHSGNTYFGGPSDHFPVYIKVRKAKR